MLVNLFIERLKLEYVGVDLSVSQAELEDGIRREKEIVEQLADMDEPKEDKDEKKKGGKGAKAGSKDPMEALKEELDQIRCV